MRSRSVRIRVLVGAALWTVGLFLLAGAVMMWLLYTGRPRVPEMIHHVFAQTIVMFALAAILVASGFVQVRRGLTSLDELRARLADVHAGRQTRVVGTHPTETQPLVNDLNALLEAHDDHVSRAQTKAGDLAHGLKTPLAVLAQETDRARSAGQTELADAVDHEVARMRRQIDYHLAQARAAASSATAGVRTVAVDALEGLRRTLDRLHADRQLNISISAPGDLAVKVQQADLEEMLGNLLDNACKWTKTRVAVTASAAGSDVVFTVDDDGPGLEPAMREAVLKRGVRADEASPGSGLGLAIVRDLATLYAGSVALGAAPIGGLRATLRLPRA